MTRFKNASLSIRKSNLKKLGSALEKTRQEAFAALRADLGKPELEALTSEIMFVQQELQHALKHLDEWTKVQTKKTPLVLWPSTSFIRPEPYGRVLIMGPWNYPYQLSLSPVVAALAAGNSVLLKPSEYAPATAAYLQMLAQDFFEADVLEVRTGGVEVATQLLNEKHDFIFFTGGESVGKIVMKKAAETLTPVVLELGGKSPAIVDLSADLKMTARKIVWGKFFNAGQTCVAPDFVCIPKRSADTFIDLLQTEIKTQWLGPERQMARICYQKHFDRLLDLISDQQVIGGKFDRDSLRIEPCLVLNPSWDSRLMKEEIFGPILPILSFESRQDLCDQLQNLPTPLALYIFGDRSAEDFWLESLESGGVAVNDCLIHLNNPELPFGGKGASGFGAYHGKSGFDCFTHYRAVLRKSTKLDWPQRYPPYTKASALFFKFIDRFLS